MTLEEARENFAKYGAVEKRHIKNVRAPLPEEVPLYEPSRDLLVSNYYELLALHRAIMEAKFSEDSADRDIAGSPILSSVHRRVIHLLMAADVKKNGDKATIGWEQFLAIGPESRCFRVALRRASEIPGWHSLSYGEQKRWAADLLEPFRASEKLLAFFISQVFVFTVQTGNPEIQKEPKVDTTEFFELFKGVFLQETEEVIINWNGQRLHLNYRHDVPNILLGIVEMVSAVLGAREGEYLADFGLGSWITDWSLKWSKRSMEATVSWFPDGSFPFSELNKHQVLYTTTESFVAEWGELFRAVDVSLSRAGVDFSRYNLLQKMRELLSEIHKRGRLYRPGRV
jgi:hypothetical protein